MTTAGWYLLALMVGVTLVVILEGARQERAMRRTKDRGTEVRLIRSGLLGLHELLEPDRKVEVLREEHEADPLPSLPSDPPEPPGGDSPTPRR